MNTPLRHIIPLILIACIAPMASAAPFALRAEQLTHGPQHHFYGYIGHVGNTPWNGNGRYLVLLRTSFQDHMPAPDEPADDGLWKIDINTGEKTLLVSYRQLAEALRPQKPNIDECNLFLNHTLSSREGDLIYAYARSGWFGEPRAQRIDAPFVVGVDGKGLQFLPDFIGGHPEWAPGGLLIGVKDGRQILYDPREGKVVGTIGSPESIPDPGADVALSPDGKWLINGRHEGATNCFTVIHIETGEYVQTPCFDIGPYAKGDRRIDPAPCWNRDGTAFAFPALAPDATRQTFVIRLAESQGD